MVYTIDMVYKVQMIYTVRMVYAALLKMSEWMDGLGYWIPLRLLRLLEHLRC